jgi:hypothetical protein
MERQTFLASKIEEMLNLHSTFKFKVRDHVADLDEFYDDMVQGFQMESPYFWALLTDYTGEYIPIKGSNSTNENCALYLHIPAKFIDEAMVWLKTTFASLVVANEFEDTVGIKSLMTMNIPTIFDVRIRDGIDYAIVHISFAFRSSSKFVFGNSVKMYINGVEVVPYDGRLIEQVKQNTNTYYDGAITGIEYTEQNIMRHTHSFYFENKEPFNSVMDEIVNGKQNIHYSLKYDFSNGTSKTYNVILNSGSINFALGQFIVLTVAFAYAGEA